MFQIFLRHAVSSVKTESGASTIPGTAKYYANDHQIFIYSYATAATETEPKC